MNLVLLRQRASSVVIPRSDRRARHILDVLKRRAPHLPLTSTRRGPHDSKPISVGVVGGGSIGSAVLAAVDQSSITLQCEWPTPAGAIKADPTERLLPLDVLVGMTRPQTCKKILRDLSTLGVRSIGFVVCELTERSYARSSLWSDGAWEQYIEHGAEQAFRTSLPSVRQHESLEAALTELPSQLRQQQRVLCHDDGTGHTPSLYTMPLPPLPEVPPPLPCPSDQEPMAPLCLICGAERGFTEKETSMLQSDHGFTMAHLGAPIFRSELAVCLASAVLLGRHGLLEQGFVEARDAAQLGGG